MSVVANVKVVVTVIADFVNAINVFNANVTVPAKIVVNAFNADNVVDLNVFNVVNVSVFNAKVVDSVALVVVIAQEFVNVVK